jgi:hypothetical protein
MKMGQLDPSLKLGSVCFFFYVFKKKTRTRVSNSGLAINAKVRREVANLLYLFILFTKKKKSAHRVSRMLNFNCYENARTTHLLSFSSHSIPFHSISFFFFLFFQMIISSPLVLFLLHLAFLFFCHRNGRKAERGQHLYPS